MFFRPAEFGVSELHIMHNKTNICVARRMQWTMKINLV